MARCLGKDAIITKLRTLKATDTDFSDNFDKVALELKKHMLSGHVVNKRHERIHTIKPCPGN